MKLGFCGLGLMGAPMVRRLLAAGHQVQVWNRSAAKAEALAAQGARVVGSAREAASGVDGVLMCLFDAHAVEAVVFGSDGVAEANTAFCGSVIVRGRLREGSAGGYGGGSSYGSAAAPAGRVDELADDIPF